MAANCSLVEMCRIPPSCLCYNQLIVKMTCDGDPEFWKSAQMIKGSQLCD